MGTIKMYAREIRYKVNGPGTEETATGYVASPARYSTISVEDLADHISADSRVERSKVAVITDSLIKQIREMVLNGHKIEIPHLGSFKPKIKGGMAVSIEDIDAAAFNARVKFLPSMELKRELQSARIVKTEIPSAPAAPTVAEVKAAILANVIKDGKAFMKEYDPEGQYTIQQEDGNVVSRIVCNNLLLKDGTEAGATFARVIFLPATGSGLPSVGYSKLIATKDETNGFKSFDALVLTENASSYKKGWLSETAEAKSFMSESYFKVPQPFEID